MNGLAIFFIRAMTLVAVRRENGPDVPIELWLWRFLGQCQADAARAEPQRGEKFPVAQLAVCHVAGPLCSNGCFTNLVGRRDQKTSYAAKAIGQIRGPV